MVIMDAETKTLYNYVDLINSTKKTLSGMKTISTAYKQKAIRFLHLMGDMLDICDEETRKAYKDYEHYLYERRIII